MTQRSASVVVDATDWQGELEELARRVMPVTRRPPEQLVPLLERGAVTIEADLSIEEAQRLHARLATLGVPSQVLYNGKPLTPAKPGGAPRPKEDAAASEIRVPRLAPPPGAGELKRGDTQRPGAGAQDVEIQDWGDFADFEVTDIDTAGWDQIFASREARAGAAGKRRAQKESLDFGATYQAHQERGGAAATDAAVPDVSFGAQPAPPPAQGAQPARPEAAKRGFDGLRVAQALDGAGRAPYAPDGFDDRIEHVPAFAAALSFLAPGAGQIYNGEEERVRELCIQAALVRPWWRSVGQAKERAEKIRTYWAPRPAPGALKRALRHVALCWLVAGLGIGALVWAGSAIYRLASQPGAPTMEQGLHERALALAHQRVTQAGVQALAQAQAARKAEPEVAVQRFTMSDEERAQRLFLRGYAYCERGDFTTCASAMKQVSVLSQQLRRKAILMQAWASMRHAGNDKEPMPDVGPVESLSEFELQMLNLETSMQEGAP